MNVTSEHEKALALVIDADPYPQAEARALMMVAFGIVTLALDPIVISIDDAIWHLDFAGDDWFKASWKLAIEMGPTLAVQKFGVNPTSFPGRLAIFAERDRIREGDDARLIIPALLVDDRLITWGFTEHRLYATDKATRASEGMRAGFDLVESDRRRQATH